MKFKYKKFASGVFRPIIPIEVGHDGFFVPYSVLVDSGADICILNAQIGELIGLDIKKGAREQVSGITGAEPEDYYIHEITMKVGGWPFKIAVGFLPSLQSHYSYGVVGQKGFFDIFKVMFDLSKEEIEINEHKKK